MKNILRELQALQEWAFENDILFFEVTTQNYKNLPKGIMVYVFTSECESFIFSLEFSGNEDEMERLKKFIGYDD